MPDPNSPVTVFLRAPGNIKLSAILQLFPSITFTSRKRSARGDSNLQQAEVYLRVTKEELDKIVNASQQANETYAGEIEHIKDQLNHINFAIATVKKSREGSSTLGRTFQRLGNDVTTKDLLKVAIELSEKAKHTSARVELTNGITLQTAPSSECTVFSDNQLTGQDNLCGIGFAFDGQPNSDDARKIESMIHLVDTYPDNDSIEESGSVCGLRSRKSDLSTYSFHYWGSDAYDTGQFSSSSDGSSSHVSSQYRPSSGMLLGAHATLQNCNINIFNMQSNDSCAVSDATANLGVSFAGGGHLNTSPPSTVRNSKDIEAIQTNVSLQDATVDGTQSIYEQHTSSSTASSLEPQNGIPVVPTMESPSKTHSSVPPASLPASGSENTISHSMIVGESAIALSPTMNINSPGAGGATRIYLGVQPACYSPYQMSAQSPSGSVMYDPTFHEKFQDACTLDNQDSC